MKIIGVVGSRRKGGNTEFLVKKALEAVDNDIETELIILYDKDIKHCRACGFKICSQGCILKDDMQTIYPKILEADGLIIGSPTYFAMPSSLISAFLQRLIHLKGSKNGNLLKNKVGGVVATGRHRCGGQTCVISTIKNFFDVCDMINISSEGFELDSHLGAVGIGKDVSKDELCIKSAQQLGKRMSEVIKKLK